MESTNRSSELISLVKEALADLKAQRCGSARESKRYMEDAATLAVGRIEDVSDFVPFCIVSFCS